MNVLVVWIFHFFSLSLNLNLIRFYLFCSPSLVDIKAISSSDVNSRIAHALSLAAERYDVPSLFEPEGKKFCKRLRPAKKDPGNHMSQL